MTDEYSRPSASERAAQVSGLLVLALALLLALGIAFLGCGTCERPCTEIGGACICPLPDGGR